MADSALETTTPPSYRGKAKDTGVTFNTLNTNIKTPGCSSLRLSSPKRKTGSVATGNVPLLDSQAASTTKTTADSDKRKKSKMAVEVKSSPLVLCETIELASHSAIQEMSANEQFDDEINGQHRPLKTAILANDEKKRRRSDRCDSSESSDSGVASLTCSDASSWSSSSDITEPVSPASPASSQPSPLDQTVLDSSAASHHFVAINSVRIAEPCMEPELKCDDTCDKAKGNISPAVMVSSHCITALKRQRRYSDSTPIDWLSHQQKSGGTCVRERGKRIRRLSGESVSHISNSLQTEIHSEERSCLGENSLQANVKRMFTLFWRDSNSTNVEPNLSRKLLNATNLRQSWPLAKQIQQKTGQLKITEFFPSQVKQHWNYSRFSDVDNKGDKFPIGLNNPNWRLPGSRVAIVSVAQVDHHNDDVTLNPHSFTSVGFERPVCATRPLDCVFPAKTPGPPPIRFPIDQVTVCHKNDVPLPTGTSVVQCLWQHCTSRLTSGQSLLEHIQTAHVASQASAPSSLIPWSGSGVTAEVADGTASCDELYSCQWEGCKVQGRTSSSRAWLERHVLLHGGHKPFRCIVDLCEQRFNSQAALQRHVNAHFNQEPGQNGNSHGLRRDNAPAKVIRRNSKKLKHRRSKVSPARLFDYFDSGIMERLRHQLISSHTSHDRLGLSLLTNGLTVRSQVIARRLDANGKSRVLLRWLPTNVLPDQWVLEEEVVTHKNVSFRNLTSDVQIELLIRPTSSDTTKQRRKR